MRLMGGCDCGPGCGCEQSFGVTDVRNTGVKRLGDEAPPACPVGVSFAADFACTCPVGSSRQPDEAGGFYCKGLGSIKVPLWLPVGASVLGLGAIAGLIYLTRGGR